MRQTAIAFSLAILCGAQGSAFAAAVSKEKAASSSSQKFFDQAQLFLRKNDFKQAEIELRRSIAERPDVALTHYYLANTLVHLQRHEEAMEEFQRCYRLDPYGLTSGYCRKALVTYGQKSSADADSVSVDGELDAVVAMQRYKTAVNSDSKKPSVRIAAIKGQAEREKQRHQQVAESFVKSANLAGEFEAKEIRNRAKEEVDNIINGPRSSMPSRQALDAERATAIRKNAEEMEIIVKDRAAKRSQQYSQWSKEKGDLLDETVSNLENQINTKNLPGTPKLNEIGTDLFVRNYGQSSSQASTRPAVAKVGSGANGGDSNPATAVVGDSQAVSKSVDDSRANSNGQNNNVPISSRSVHGQIVPPM